LDDWSLALEWQIVAGALSGISMCSVESGGKFLLLS